MKTAIIGGGIAGSVLWLHLYERNIKASLYDMPQLSASSRIAAGVINPIVLKRLKTVQGAQDFLDKCSVDYPRWEELLSTRFFHPVPLKHLFHSAAEVNQWIELSDRPSHSPFLGPVSTQAPLVFTRSYGMGEVKQASWLHTPAFLDAVKKAATAEQCYYEQFIGEEDFSSFKDYDAVIVCTGHLMSLKFPRLRHAFAPTRGEVMIIESEDLPTDAIYHGPVFILPLGNNLFKVGATYHWDQLEDTPTEAGLHQLKSQLEKFFTGNYKVVEHSAGVRPNTKDRKPLLGRLQHNLFAFNGLGSRGALMAPYLAELLASNILTGSDIPDAYDIQRFLS